MSHGSPRANLFVPHTSPRYAAMVDRSRHGDPADFQFGEGLLSKSPGIWVPLAWWDMRGSPARQAEAAE